MSIGVQKDVLLGIIRIYHKTNINLSWSEEDYDLEVCKVYGYIVIKQKVSIMLLYAQSPTSVNFPLTLSRNILALKL